MRLKADDLELLLWYVKKEQAPHVDVTQVAQNFEVIFEFKDAEQRDCEIVIYEMSLQKPVRLVKAMDLETRLEKEDK
jgi:hypothetical protein